MLEMEPYWVIALVSDSTRMKQLLLSNIEKKMMKKCFNDQHLSEINIYSVNKLTLFNLILFINKLF
jgi:hypothetical protein